MVSNRFLSSAVVMLVALLVISSSLAIIYYGQVQKQSSEAKTYENELSSALSQYDQLGLSYSSSLQGYNRTLLLLSQALSNMNTSTTAYIDGSEALVDLWSRYLSLESSAGATHAYYSVDLFVDFGNGTKRWYNNTAVQPGWNDYLATVVVFSGSVQAAWYPQYQEHFVTGIGGAVSAAANSWFFWTQNGTGWQLAPTGADAAQAFNGTTFAWTLCGYDQYYNPTCSP